MDRKEQIERAGEGAAGKDVILASHGWELMYYRGRRRLQKKAAI